MATLNARFSREDFARKGQEIYERDIGPVLRPEDANKFVAIDIESANFEIDANDYTATERLLTRIPDAQIWLVRVGQPAAYRVGGPFAPGGTG